MDREDLERRKALLNELEQIDSRVIRDFTEAVYKEIEIQLTDISLKDGLRTDVQKNETTLVLRVLPSGSDVASYTVSIETGHHRHDMTDDEDVNKLWVYILASAKSMFLEEGSFASNVYLPLGGEKTFDEVVKEAASIVLTPLKQKPA